MAMHKPIVITDLKECRQYKSVMIAKTHEEFIQLIEEALSKENDEKSIALLDKEARENDWQRILENIHSLLHSKKMPSFCVLFV